MRIGIDLGGTKIEGILLGNQGEVLERCRRPTPREGGYCAVLDAVVELVGDLTARARTPCPVGMGIPGCVDSPSRRVKNANSTVLIGRPLGQDLEDRLGRPARLANDANCFAVAEALAGAGRGLSVIFGVILGTGVGGGLVIDGRVRQGLHGIAGEWGHSPIGTGDPATGRGPPCYCGLRGCVETRLSGPGLEAEYLRQGGAWARAPDILQRAREGEAAALRTHALYLRHFGEALARVIHILDPDAIILGGGLSNDERLYDRGRAEIEKALFNPRLQTPLLRNELGDSAGVFGAAWLWGREGPDPGQA